MIFAKKIIFIIIFFSVSCSLLSQVDINFSYDPLRAPNTYRSPQNPYYWGNKSDKSTAWQQDVHYSIEAKLDENQDRIDGIAKVTYWNNSKDSISQVFFHLFQNTFLENSYKNLYLKSIGKPVKREGFQKNGIEVKDFRIFVGKGFERPTFSIDKSIMKVDLETPLRPNSFVVFSISFSTFFDKSSETVPCKVLENGGNKIFKAANWYPKICRYDARTGWESNHYLGLNSAGTFGTYDVQIETPSNYVTEATGFNSKKPGFNDPFNKKQNSSSEKNIWNFHAENVHDFAFVSSPVFKRTHINAKRKSIIYLSEDDRKDDLDSSLFYIYSSIDFMEKYLGKVSQHKFVFTDFPDTESYPMMIFLGNSQTNDKELICKMICDQWLSSMMILDEEKNFILKEGLSLYLSSKILESIDKKKVTFPDIKSNKKESIGNDYGFYLLNNSSEERLNLYLKSYELFLQMENLVGEQKFLSSIKTFFKTWRFDRPFLSDFASSLNRQNSCDFNPLIQQWTSSKPFIDYAIESMSLYSNSSDNYTVKIKRIGDIVMPINILIESKNDQMYRFCIPVGNLPIPKGQTLLPKWLGVDDYNRNYTFTCKIEGGIKSILLDPEEKTLDIDRNNNYWSEK